MRLALLLVTLTACGGAAPPPVTPAAPVPEARRAPAPTDDGFLEDYAATLAFRLGEPNGFTVAPDGRSVLFLRATARSFVKDLYLFDLESRTERVLLTAETILGQGDEALSPEEHARRERMRERTRGITSYELSSDGRRVLVPLSGRLFVVELATAHVTELRSAAGFPDDPRFSPDGSQVACVRNGDLYVIDVASGAERRITSSATHDVTNGLAEFVAQEEMGRYEGYVWSPDGTEILYQQTDVSPVERLHIVDPMHPEAEPQSAAYPRAGHNNAVVRVGIVSARGGATRWIDWNSETHPYLYAVSWAKNAPPTLVVEDRVQREALVLAIDPRNGTTQRLLTESDDVWLNLHANLPAWTEDGSAFLWATERGGAPQLELRSREGALVRALTEAELGFESLLRLEAGVAWIAGSAEPTESHVFRVPLEASQGGPERMTEPGAEHMATIGAGEVWVRATHPSHGASTFTVLRGQDALAELPSVAEHAPFEPSPELATVGSRDYRAVIVRPRDFDAGRRYPVIVWVYGGPGHRQVGVSQRRYLLPQWFADQGYIVVSADGRGTPGRGRAWERAIAGNFIDTPLGDQVEALEALGARYPEMDLTKVGIMGWSFGGYFSAMAVMQRPDVFDVAVAGAPVTDWHDYDTHYTERYLGLPADNIAGYTASSALTFAPRLEKPLLIVHGTADDNVYFMHAVKLSDALLRAGRPHGFLPLSGFTHMVAEPEVSRHLQERILGFLADGLR